MSDCAYDFFISYSFSDVETVEPLCAYLEGQGYKCFMAHRNMPRGVSFSNLIPWAIDQSRMMIAIMTKRFDASTHTSREVSLASDSGMPILTVRMEEYEMTGAKKYYLRDVNWINALTGIEGCYGEIEQACRRLLEENPERGKKEEPSSVDEIPRKKRPLMNFSNKLSMLAIAMVIVMLGFIVVDHIFRKDVPVTTASGLVDTVILERVVVYKEHDTLSVENAKQKKMVAQNIVKDIQALLDAGNLSENSRKLNDLILKVVNQSNSQVASRKTVDDLNKVVKTLDITRDHLEDGTKKGLKGAVVANKERISEDDCSLSAKTFFQLGMLYYYGIGVENDYEEALNWFRNVNEEDVDLETADMVRFYTALCYIRKGTDADNTTAKTYLEKMSGKSKKVEADRKYYLDRLARGSESTKKDDVEERYWAFVQLKDIRKECTDRFFKMYNSKGGNSKPIYTARELETIDAAANANCPEAMHELYYNYLVRVKDTATAVYWINTAYINIDQCSSDKWSKKIKKEWAKWNKSTVAL